MRTMKNMQIKRVYHRFLLIYVVSGKLLAGERNPHCPDAENSSRNTEPFCQNSKGEFK